MSAIRTRRFVRRTCFSLPITWILASCSRAPALDILGSFFPGWLVCFVPAILLTVLVQQLLSWRQMKLAYPVLVYPSLTAFFTFLLWLILFH